MGNKAAWLITLLFVFLSLPAQERKEVPASIGHVNDFAGVLQPSEVSMLESKLKAYEDSTSTQIAVVIESTLNGRDKFDRAMDFARGWQVGQEGKNNGVVLYIAIQDRGIFIMPANKTQGNLPDGLVGDIIRTEIAPSFKQQQYYQGINNGVDAIISALKGEFKADPKKRKSGGTFGTIMTILVILIILWAMSKRKGGNSGGYSSGGTYWFPTGGLGGGGSDSGGSSWGGFGGGGGFDGGGAGGDW